MVRRIAVGKFAQNAVPQSVFLFPKGPFSQDVQRTFAFAECLDVPTFSALPGCIVDCAPTYGMLSAGEEPTTAEFNNFGPGQGSAGARPGSSLCVAA